MTAKGDARVFIESSNHPPLLAVDAPSGEDPIEQHNQQGRSETENRQRRERPARHQPSNGQQRQDEDPGESMKGTSPEDHDDDQNCQGDPICYLHFDHLPAKGWRIAA